MQIEIHPALRAESVVLGLVEADVTVTEHDEALWREIDAYTAELRSSMSVESMLQTPPIKAQRDTYRRLGRDPSRYRGAAEALARRILQGKDLYRVNTVVDINNLLSLKSLHPVATYSVDRLEEPIVFRVGEAGERYKGIGKGEIDLDKIPLFADARGPFGSATSDSERAMVRPDTRHTLTAILAFSGEARLAEHLELARTLLQRHAAANVTTAVVK
jgi:DNA/RNA-binding domain of Phe-tRNA-synthetase-like protein